MPRIGDIATRIRAKNAGPFVLTIDIFCPDPAGFDTICRALPTTRIAALFHQPRAEIRRFELPALNVLKFSLPRPVVQGSHNDRDMHASGWALLISALEAAPPTCENAPDGATRP